MIGADEEDTRGRDAIERELRLLASVRSAYRERGGALPSISQMDALLDELLELEQSVDPQRGNGTRGPTSNPCR
jgi:hypothetical protein